jgi:CheY-like chemotaxis protein
MDNKQLKVLVIEGNSKIAEELKKELSVEGYLVTCAVAIESGLLRAKAFKFDFFVVNCGLDGKQGFNFASTISKEEEYKNVPFIFTINPKVNVDVRLRKFSHQFDLLRLPVDVTELKIRVPRLFNQTISNEPEAPEIKKIDKEEKVVSTTKKILLVEDNMLNQKVLGMFIAKLGFEYEIASNGQMAVDLSKENEYAFILMDIYMPGMDGTEATELIRSNEAEGNHRAKIIAITANESAESVRRCYDSGMDDYLVKPFTVEVLREKLV